MENHAGGVLAALSDELAATVERVGRSVVAVEARDGIGSSGFFLRPNIVVTADHALERDDVRIVAADGAGQDATVVARDPSTDIALLRVAPAGEPVGANGDAKAGAIALAVARDDDGDVAATMGVVGTVGGRWRTWRGGDIDAFVRPDLALSPRFSGSPLVDGQGRLLGLNTWGLSRRQSIAVPASTLLRVTDALATRGHVARGYLGIAMQAVRLPERFGGGSGVIALAVEPGGPADAAGIIVGDIITSLRGHRVADSDDVQSQLDPSSVGSRADITVLRGGNFAGLTVTIGERPRRGDDDD